MVASNEVRKKEDGSGDRINVGKTTRDGWDISFSIRPHPWVSMWGSYSRVKAVYTDPGEALAALKGKDIELIPKETGKLGVDFNHPTGISGSFWLEHQGDYYVLDDATNENETVGDYTIFNFKLAYKLGQLNKKFKDTTIGFEVKNVFDENYYTYVWNLDDGFQPGDARSFYVWMSLEF
jgi:iron complex outermembrane receptor protein